MRLLAKRGAEISPVAQEGITPLNMACCQASVPRVRLLLKLGADPGRPADVGCLLQIVSCMPSLAPLLDEENGQREEREALMHRQLAIAEMLIAAGIDLDVRVRDNPVIHIAAMVDSRRLMAALLRAGARCYIYAPAVNGIADTPLLRAAGYANPAIVHLLLQAGALETTWDQSGRLPLEVVGRFSDKHAPRPKGVLRRREEATRRELLRGPAFRARSWAWPDVAVAAADAAAAAGGKPARAEARAGEEGGAQASPLGLVARGRPRGRGSKLSGMWRYSAKGR